VKWLFCVPQLSRRLLPSEAEALERQNAALETEARGMVLMLMLSGARDGDNDVHLETTGPAGPARDSEVATT